MSIFEMRDTLEVPLKEGSFLKETDVAELDKPYDVVEIPEKRELTPEQKKEVQAETGWSEDISDKPVY